MQTSTLRSPQMHTNRRLDTHVHARKHAYKRGLFFSLEGTCRHGLCTQGKVHSYQPVQYCELS